MAHLQTRVITHAQKVCSLYKRACRNIEAYTHMRTKIRVEQVLLRARFDANKNVKDHIKAQKLLDEGEEELFSKISPFPKKFPHSPGGICYGREVFPPDSVLDFWEPIEKSRFPHYFARREQRKKEFIKLYENNFGRKNDTNKI